DQQKGQHDGAAKCDAQHLVRADRQEVAEQVGEQVDAHLGETERHQTQSQCAVRKDAQYGVTGQTTSLFHRQQEEGQQATERHYAELRVDVEQKAERNTEQG